MFKKFIKNDLGTVTIMTAFLLPLMIAMVSLAVEFGQGLSTKMEDQRVADLAAYAGGLAYNSSGSKQTMSSAVEGVAALNGIPSNDVSANLVASPTGDGNEAVSVTIASSNLLLLAPVLGYTKTSLPISSSSYAEVKSQVPGCFVALGGSGAGITLSGGTSVSAPNCSVASNAKVSVPCGTSMTTKTVDYNSSGAPSEPCGGIKPPSGTSSVSFVKTSTSDPLAANSAVSAATSRMTSVSDLSSPTGPSTPTGGAIDFSKSKTVVEAAAAADNCAAAPSGGDWTLTCSGYSTYYFGAIKMGGGQVVNFNTSGSASNTYDFSGSITNSGGSVLNFGPGTYNIAQGIMTTGGTKTTFGAGTFNIGPGASSCNGAGDFSICNTGTSLTFGGPSVFVLAQGVYNAGGETLTLGGGSTNSFEIGASSSGYAIDLGGGSITTFADALGSSSLFSLVGNVNASGGSCLMVSAAAEHDINGNFSSSGGTILGAGVYSINGYIALGANGGGDVTCNGTSVGVSGAGVTLVASGSDTPASGACAGQAFCVAAGYANVTLTAPTSGPTANLAIIGPTSSINPAGALFTAGASNASLSGAIYFPEGTVKLSGGASLGSGSGQCLELIGSQITLSGGSAVGSACIGGNGGASSSASVTLVQ